MTSKQNKIRGIIAIGTLSATAVGMGMAQLPGSDAPVLCGIQTTMIVAIAHEHGAHLTKTAAADLLLTFAATMTGRTLSQIFVGWIPGWGNAINATTAASITSAVGAAADAYFDESRPQSDPAHSR
jgi:uncharacterized protein (DUF697 family)